MSDPFNYPMPNRTDTMGLSTINGAQDNVRTTTRKFATTRVDSQANNVKDIEGKWLILPFKNHNCLLFYLGASPKLHGSRTFNKAEYSNQNWDIHGSAPRALHMPLNKPNNNQKTSDIFGASPQCNKF